MIERINWNKFQELINALGKNIISSGYNADILIAVARGGWIPTRYLSDILKITKISSIGLSYSDDNRDNIETYSMPINVNTKKILLIEDRLETGKTMLKAKKILKEKYIEIKTVCIYTSSSSIINPDYSLGINDNNILFPWE